MNEQQQFVLRWHYHDTTVVNALPCFLENDILTDVILAVGQQQFRAHKIILAMCSAYFFQMFQEINTAQHPIVVLHNVTIEDIRAILAFIYKGQCIVTREHLPNLLSVAKLLKIQGLCDMKVPDQQIKQEDNVEFLPPPPPPSATQIPSNTIKEITKICDSLLENNSSKIEQSTKAKINSKIEEKESSGKKLHQSQLKEACMDLQDNISSSIKKQTCKDSSETCKCFLCGKYLSNQYNLRVHMETHEEAFHACQSCPHVSRSRDALRKHVSYRHPEEYHTRKRKKIDNL